MIEKLALKKNLITRAQFDEAVAVCGKALDRESAFKKFFIARNWISVHDIGVLIRISQSLAFLQKGLKFGAIAVKMGYISKSVLDLTLDEQKKALQGGKTPKLIGDLLVDSGMLTSKQREDVLGEQDTLKQGFVASDKADFVENAPGVGREIEEKGKASKEDIGSGLILEVTSNRMEAFLLKTEEFDDSIQVKDIKELFQERYLVFGLVDDIVIGHFLISNGFKTKGLLVARGISAIEGQDAKIEYYFDTDHLKAGGLEEGGGMDFKERGTVPLVEAGVLLAEKILKKEPVNGRNIFGEEQIMPEVNDVQLKAKEGTRLSDDELRLFSTVRGFPRLSWAGSVMVAEEFITKGDVNFETGHIRFKGNVTVKGCIKDGFEVEGCNVSAEEIRGGIVRAEGDLVVRGGVNDADLYVRGNFKAKFVHKSRIVCLGNVWIESEIVDSSVKSSGACTIEKGDVISCEINAKMGLEAGNVDTGISISSTITLGHDSFVEEELKKIKGEMKICISDIELLKQERAELVEEIGKLLENSVKLAHELDRFRSDKGASNLISQLEKPLNDCFNSIERKEIARDQVDKKLFNLSERVDDLSYEKDNFRAWSIVNPPKPVMVIRESLFPGVRVYGLNSQKVFKEKVTRAKVVEVAEQDVPGESIAYRIVIHGS